MRVRRFRPEIRSFPLLSSAAYGLSIATYLARRIPKRATAGQLIGFAKLNGFSPSAELKELFLLLGGAVAGALLGRFVLTPLGRRIAVSPPASTWAWAGLWLSPILAATGAGTGSVALGGLAAFVFLAVFSPAIRDGLGEQRLGLPAAFAQAMLVWTFLAGFVVRSGHSPVSLAAVSLALAIAEGVWLGGGSLEAAAGAFAPSALLVPLTLFRTRPPALWIAAGVAAVLLPILAASVVRLRAGIGHFLRAAVRYCLLPACVVALAAAVFLQYAPRADPFEDGHQLLPASEYLRGELPYRDIVPGHGLLADGLLQAAEMRVFGADYRGLSRGDRLVNVFFWPAMFAVGCAASGSAAVGFSILLLAFLLMPQFGFFRLMASLVILTPAAFAQRRRTARPWAVAGAAVPLGVLMAVEFAAYAALAALLSLLFVARGRRRANLASFVEGGAVVSLAIAGTFAGLGILGPFLEVTFRDLRGLLPRYSLGMSPLPGSFNGLRIPDLATAVGDPASLYFWCLIASALLFAVIVAKSPFPGARARAVFLFLAWFLAATLSVLERRHENYALFLAPAILVLTARWIAAGGSARKALALALLFLALGTSRPLASIRTWGLTLASTADPAGEATVDRPSRARGAVFDPESTAEIAEVRAFLESGAIAEKETWLDFTNHGVFYFLFDRDCPIRYYEVAFFETPRAQQEVIRAIDSNPRVTAVLSEVRDIKSYIDGIPNRDRAPLVWAYVEAHFHPSFRGRIVEFWSRN